jgi:hypothetical protein
MNEHFVGVVNTENDNNRNTILIQLNQTNGFGSLMFCVQLNMTSINVMDSTFADGYEMIAYNSRKSRKYCYHSHDGSISSLS